MIMAEVIGCRWRYHNNMFLSVYLKHVYVHCLIYQTTKPSAGTDRLVNSYYYNINHNVLFLLLLLLVLLPLLLYSPNFFIILSISWHSLCSFASTYCTNRVRSDSVSVPHLLVPEAGCPTAHLSFSPPNLCACCICGTVATRTFATWHNKGANCSHMLNLMRVVAPSHC